MLMAGAEQLIWVRPDARSAAGGIGEDYIPIETEDVPSPLAEDLPAATGPTQGFIAISSGADMSGDRRAACSVR